MPVDAGTIYSEVRIELDRLRADIKSMNTQFNQFASQNKKQSGTVQKNWTKSFQGINLAGVAAFAGLGLAIKKAIGTFSDFEQSLANVQSVARGTPEEFARMEEAARRAGETTRFTASEAADAMYSLASAGLNTSEVIASLDGVLQLAGATQSDLASTSAAVVSTLSQYGLEAKESTRVSNVFAAAIANSQANMDKLANAFRQVGPVAGALGISLEETTGAIQALLDAGFQGEQAGTALRNILSALSDETDPTTRKLIDLGLTFDQLNPAVNGLTDIIGNLNAAGLETGEVLGAFGRRAGPQILSLLRVGQQGLEDYTDAVTDTNAAAEAYAIQNDTLAGSQDRLKSALESTTIAFVQEISPALRRVTDLLTGLIKAFGQLPTFIKVALAVIAGGIPIVTGAAVAVAALSTAVGALLGPVTIITGAIAVLTAGVVSLNNARIDRLAEEFGDVAEKADVSAEAAEFVAREFQRAVNYGDDLNETVDRMSTGLGLSKDQIIDIAQETADLSDEQREVLRTIEEQLRVQRNQNDYENEAATLLELKNDRVREELALRRAEREEAERARREEEDARLAEIARIDGVVAALTAAEKSYQDEIRITSMLQNEGLVSAKEALENQIASAEQLVTSLFEIGYHGQLIAETWEGQTTPKIQEGNLAIREMVDTVLPALRAELRELNDQAETTGSSNIKNFSDLSDVTQDYEDRLTLLNATEEEALKLERKRALEAIAASGASRDAMIEAAHAVGEYFDAVEEARKEVVLFGNVTEKEAKVVISKLDAMTKSVMRMFTAFESGQAEDILNAVGDSLDAVADAIDNVYVKAAAAVLKTIAAIVKIFKAAEERRQQYNNTLAQLDAEITQLQLENQKKLLDQQYDAEIRQIERVRDARISGLTDTLDEELQLILAQLGIIEQTTEQKYDEIYQDILDTAEDAGRELTEAELEQIQAILDAQKKADEDIANADKEYKEAIAQWNYDKAVADKAAAEMQAKINKQRALSELSWWDVHVRHRDRDIKDLFNTLIATIRDTPLPPIPSFQTGGIVPGSSFNGDNVLVRANSGELYLTRQQQKQLFDMIDLGMQPQRTDSNSGRHMTMIVELDGRIIAQDTVDWIDNGQVRFRR